MVFSRTGKFAREKGKNCRNEAAKRQECGGNMDERVENNPEMMEKGGKAAEGARSEQKLARKQGEQKRIKQEKNGENQTNIDINSKNALIRRNLIE